MDKISSGLDGLDNLLQGGFPSSSAIGLIGDVGSGKEILCGQIVWSLLNRDYYVLFYAVDKSSEDIRAGMEQFGWNVESFEKEEKLHFVDTFSRGMQIIEEKMYAPDEAESELVTPDKISFNYKEMISEGRNFTLKMRLRRRKLFVVYYSLSPLFTISDHREVLRFLQYAKYATRISRAVGLVVLHSGIHGEGVENAFQQLADGTIQLRKKRFNGHIARFIRISKMARIKTSENYYPLEITDQGITVYPITVNSM